MKSIEKEFDKDKENIISVWFDAWKYENEKEFALIPLLKTINYSIKRRYFCFIFKRKDNLTILYFIKDKINSFNIEDNNTDNNNSYINIRTNKQF